MVNDNTENAVVNFVRKEYFKAYDCQQLGKIDFCVLPKENSKALSLENAKFYLWAEAKKKKSDIVSSIAQLILTIGRDKTYLKYAPPKYLGCFDEEQIAFIPYNDIQEVFNQNDFNWLVTPSDHNTKEFKQLEVMIRNTVQKYSNHYTYCDNNSLIKDFIKNNFTPDALTNKKQITTDNLLRVYMEWQKEVQPTICCDWARVKKSGIIDADFFLADLLSKNNLTIKEKLYVVLTRNTYELNKKIDEAGLFTSSKVSFRDEQKSHTRFWNRYERPPAKEYWEEIISRRDILVPQDVRERKGSFFTPGKWVSLSQDYIARTLGETWQKDYVIWDCAAGTGNLLAGLQEKYKIYASTLDIQDVDVIKDRVKNGAALLESHVFQFDFLNDDLAGPKVPDSLKEILRDPQKRKRLVIYINPPYAEVGSKIVSEDGTKGKPGVNQTKIHDKYILQLGTAGRELFAQFFIRINNELQGCIIANFSTLKILQGAAFETMRKYFTPKLKSLFLVPANTFDNVKGEFPIGFFIWDTDQKEVFNKIEADVYDKDGQFIGKKSLISNNNYINKWINLYKDEDRKVLKDLSKAKIESRYIGYMDGISSNDFQHNNILYITKSKFQLPNPRGIWINKSNLIPVSIYLAVRHVIKATWLNDRDQFLYPNDAWKADKTFQSNCLMYTLFSAQNRISCRDGVNHWIPFSESDVNAADSFTSHFMYNFITGKAAKSIAQDDAVLLDTKEESYIPDTAIEFSAQASSALSAARALFSYYHKKAGDLGVISGYNANASLYDIKSYFQGKGESGRMNSTSEDEKYNALLSALKDKLQVLGSVIEDKVYEYGFLIR